MLRLRSLCAACGAMLLIVPAGAAAQPSAPQVKTSANYQDWKHSGSVFILTTRDGVNLPSTASVKEFPLLVRLHKDFFDFTQAKANGDDIRFATSAGQPLAYEIDEWDASAGTASVWVRIPMIQAGAQQELKLHWGKPDAVSESNGKAVFNDSNGHVSVWHMNDVVKDEVGTLDSQDAGTTTTHGMIGKARHFVGQKGVFCGDKIPNYPSGDSSHTTEVWFRAEQPNSTIIGWGNEGGGRGSKVRMQLRSPPHVHIDSDFSDVSGKSTLPLKTWIHIAHTYSSKDGKIYINGRLDGTNNPLLDIKQPARLWIGGWYGNYDFVGDIDEVRISNVARSADWVKLQYENQKPLQTAVGPLVQSGTEFSVSHKNIAVSEGKIANVSAKAGGARKLSWILKQAGQETVVAVDRFNFKFAAGRVRGDQSLTLQLKAVYANEVKTLDIPVTVKEEIPEPIFTLQAPAKWDGRETIEIVPQITNAKAMHAKRAGELTYHWQISGLAAIKKITPGKLLLLRAQNSGKLTVTATIGNGGEETLSVATIVVEEPAKDAWVERVAATDEKPVDHQFYARDDKNEGALYYNGKLDHAADSVFLEVYADDKLFQSESQKLTSDNRYAFTVKLKPGLIKYKVEFGSKSGDTETILHTASDIVCGDAYIINGQSNALATDTHEQSPPDTSDWIRSYGKPTHGNAEKNLWCNVVWKAQQGEQAELGYWGMELAKRLVESHKIPICIINGAVGGTRIDQHQRNESDAADLSTIYGRLLWRVREARLTHGIRGILWHQGESDQGAQGPDGGYGWETYQQYFVEMSAAWKQDFPNVQHYYVFQIWPNSCSMGNGHGDMLREVQRNLPRLYSKMDIMSTLGIKPAGPCHYPLVGWAEFARLIQPLIDRDFYGKKFKSSITPPNLKRAYYTSAAKDAIALEFDQPVVWTDSLIDQFYLDGAKEKVASGEVAGNIVTLKLKESTTAAKITYLHEVSWSQEKLLIGANDIAALTFYDVPILPPIRSKPDN